MPCQFAGSLKSSEVEASVGHGYDSGFRPRARCRGGSAYSCSMRDHRRDRRRRFGVVAPILQCVGGPTIQCGKRVGRIEVVGELARTRATTSVASSAANSDAAARQRCSRVGLVEQPITVAPVRAVVPGEQTEANRRGIDAIGPKPRHQSSRSFRRARNGGRIAAPP